LWKIISLKSRSKFHKLLKDLKNNCSQILINSFGILLKFPNQQHKLRKMVHVETSREEIEEIAMINHKSKIIREEETEKEDLIMEMKDIKTVESNKIINLVMIIRIGEIILIIEKETIEGEDIEGGGEEEDLEETTIIAAMTTDKVDRGRKGSSNRVIEEIEIITTMEMETGSLTTMETGSLTTIETETRDITIITRTIMQAMSLLYQ
jgi:hypothetical protein